MRRYSFEHVVQIGKVKVLRSDTDVRVSILARKPVPWQPPKKPRWWSNSPGDRWEDLAPAQARRLAHRLVAAAAKIDRKVNLPAYPE